MCSDRLFCYCPPQLKEQPMQACHITYWCSWCLTMSEDEEARFV